MPGIEKPEHIVYVSPNQCTVSRLIYPGDAQQHGTKYVAVQYWYLLTKFPIQKHSVFHKFQEKY